MALYNATSGERWTDSENWLSYAPLNQWYGITTDENDRVVELGLADTTVRGEIPAGFRLVLGYILFKLYDKYPKTKRKPPYHSLLKEVF